ncbi:MAG: putative porin, partial [Bacteroidota bacterium]
KGTLLKLFYNGYAAVRNYSMTYNHIQAGDVARDLKRYETYLGGRMSLKLDSLVEVSGVAELLMETGNYKIEGDIKSKWFEASLKQVQYAPDFVSQLYRGSHDFWENNFSAIESTQINGYVHYNSRRFVISPGFTLTRLRNYVFYKKYGDYSDVQEMLPVQSSGSQIVASPELRLSLTFLKHVTLSNRTIFTSLLDNSDDAIRLPEVFVNAQLSYANIFFNGNLDMHAGVDVHWKSPYKALGYDPVIQQFFTQDTFRPGLHSFPIVDIFFNAKIKRGRIFIKYNNLVQAITKTGYLPTPFYPGQRSILDFGFDWSFYD